MNNTKSNLSVAKLNRVERLRAKIAALTAQLEAIGATAVVSAPAAAPKQRKMSAAGIAAIRAGVRARWAKVRAQKGGAAPATPAIAAKAGSKKGKMSAAGRAAIAAAQKARWAKVKAAK